MKHVPYSLLFLRFYFQFFYKYLFCKLKYIPYTRAHNRHTLPGLPCQAAYVHSACKSRGCCIHNPPSRSYSWHGACMLQAARMHATNTGHACQVHSSCTPCIRTIILNCHLKLQWVREVSTLRSLIFNCTIHLL
jgi:hypothetical protein